MKIANGLKSILALVLMSAGCSAFAQQANPLPDGDIAMAINNARVSLVKNKPNTYLIENIRGFHGQAELTVCAYTYAENRNINTLQAAMKLGKLVNVTYSKNNACIEEVAMIPGLD
jgi:hypothetical protein